MRALVYNGQLNLDDLPNPKPKEGEALIGVIAAGICRTDIEITQGYMDFRGVLGHEFVGRVLQCESAPELIGKRIVGEINIAPGVDGSLARRHAPDRTVLGILGKDGCFAEKITLPIENLVEIPDSVSDKEAVFVEPLAAALEILEQVHLKPADRVAVVGDGKLGLLCAQVLALPGCDVTLVGKHEDKLKIAQGFGIETMLLIQLNKHYEKKFDVVVDCSGRPEGLQTSLSLVKPRGILVLKTTTAVPPDFHTAQLVIDEITLVGSRCGPFPPAVNLLARKQVHVEPLIDSIYPLADGVKALEHAATPGILKVILEVDESLKAS